MALAIVAAENSVELHDEEGLNIYSGYDQEPILCILGLVGTPIAGTIYWVVRCILEPLISSSTTDFWTCLKDDLEETVIIMLGCATVACWLDPL